MLVLDPSKKSPKLDLPSYLVYEVLDGVQIPYKRYKDVLSKKLKPEDIK